MTKQGVEQSGLLYEHPLAELIREAVAAGLSGAFRLAHESVKSVVYFDAGELIFAVSNLRAHRLSESSRKWNFVNEHQLTAVGTRASDVELGAALVSSGALTAEKLSELFSRNTASVLRTMLLWVEGSWTFDPRVRLAENIRVEINLHELLLEGARRLPPDFIAKRFRTTNEVLSINANPPVNLALQPIEAFLLSRIDPAGMRLYELLSISGLPETDTCVALYPLTLGGFLLRDQWSFAFMTETLSRFKAVDTAIRKKESGVVGSQRTTRDKIAASTTASEKEPIKEPDEQEEIAQFFSRIDAAEDFYEVLAVTQSADASMIKRTYHQLARRFHPDRFHHDAGTPLHARLQTAFARVAQAYEMLKDSTLRAAYDLRLQNERRMRQNRSFNTAGKASAETGPQSTTSHKASGSKSTGSASPNSSQKAEEAFQRGMSALKLGNMSLAVALLAEASRGAPNEARYRAYYGRSLAANRGARGQVELEMQAAISLDPTNASYRVMLAEIYSEFGLKPRAQGELERALAIDPKNAEALKLLEKLKSNG